MAECCDVCGNIGFAETIITCAKCKINQEHLYCMRTFRKEPPEVWLCEECTPRNGNQSSYEKNGEFSEAPKFIISCKDHRENLQCAYPRKLHRGRGCIDWEKKVAKGRTKYLSVEEALVLPRLQNGASTVKITSHSSPLSPKKHISSPLSRTPVNHGAHIPKFQQPNKHPTLLGLQHLKTQSLENSKKHPASSGLQHPKTQSLENSKKHPTSLGLQHPKTQSLENSKINQVAQPKVQSSKVLNGSDKTVQTPTKRHIEKQQPLKAFNPIAEVKMTEKCLEKKRNDIFSSLQSHCCKNIISGPMEKERAVETDKNIGDTKITQTKTEGTTDKHTSVTSACCPQIISVSDGCAAMELGTSNVNLMTFSTNIKKCFSDPALHPSWKGSFNICDNLNFKGFQAHHPFRVCRKVCEFSKLLPEILDFKLVPRGNIWGKLFHDYCPTREDVGLYFFPSDRDRSKEYKTLLELIQDQDLMMRKQIDNVEILVLTSTVLQMDCQKVEGEYFLWGLFHHIGKKDKVSNVQFIDKEIDIISGKDNDEVDMAGGQSVGKADSINSGDNEEVDMEIDMIGGQNVGKQDVVIPFNSSRNKSESSKPTPVTAGVTLPSISRTSDSGMQCGLLKVKREQPFEDVPPGFEPLLPRNKSESSTPTPVTAPSISKTSDSGMQCGLLKVKREQPFEDVPPGFKPLLPPRKP